MLTCVWRLQVCHSAMTTVFTYNRDLPRAQSFPYIRYRTLWNCVLGLTLLLYLAVHEDNVHLPLRIVSIHHVAMLLSHWWYWSISCCSKAVPHLGLSLLVLSLVVKITRLPFIDHIYTCSRMLCMNFTGSPTPLATSTCVCVCMCVCVYVCECRRVCIAYYGNDTHAYSEQNYKRE